MERYWATGWRGRPRPVGLRQKETEKKKKRTGPAEGRGPKTILKILKSLSIFLLRF
jgi:hypothetical protein